MSGHRLHSVRPLAVAGLAVGLLASVSPARAQTVTFRDVASGTLPKEFETGLTGKGKPGRWQVVEDATAMDGRALAQLSDDRTDYRFPLAIYMPTVPADVEVSTRFKAVSGTVDRAGGVVARLVDPNNYYIARANALENNVRFYRVVAGDRQQLASADVKVSSGAWHTLALRAEGSRFTVSFDGKPLYTVTDATFGQPGKAALWTKADSVTHFDRIEIKPLPGSGK